MNYQIQDALPSAVADNVLPTIQNTVSKQGRVNYTVVDRGSFGPHEGPTVANYTTVDQRSSGLQRNHPEVENGLKTSEKRNKAWFSQENDGHMSRQSSVDSITSESNRDMVTGAKLNPHMVPEFLTGRPMQSRDPCKDKLPTIMSLRLQSPMSLRLQHQLPLQTASTVLQKY